MAGDGVAQLHARRDRSVERVALDVGGHARNGVVNGPLQFVAVTGRVVFRWMIWLFWSVGR